MHASLVHLVARTLLGVGRMKLASLLLLAPLTTGCGTDTGSDAASLTARVGACGDFETHVIGVFSNPNEVSTIVIQRPGPQALVLSSHDKMTWKVTTSNGAVLEHIYAVGIGKQIVEVDGKNVDVITDSMDSTGVGACGYAMGGSEDGCDADSLMILASKRVHHDVTTFHGCATASKWTIGENMATTSNCEVKTQDDWAGGCKQGGGGGSACGPGGGGSGSGGGGGSGSGGGSDTGPIIQ
jgi:uncharacterized membrane protein YgcG